MGNKITPKFMNGCAGKVQHKTFLGAQYALENNRQNKNADIYKCKECSFFHIGTQKKNKSKKRLRFKNPKKANNEHKKKYKSIKKMKY